jgi:hypothetical protein
VTARSNNVNISEREEMRLLKKRLDGTHGVPQVLSLLRTEDL